MRIDSLVKTQTVQIVQQAYTVEEPDIRATQVLYPMAQKAMGSGMYCPNRQSHAVQPEALQLLEALRRGVRRPGPAVLTPSARSKRKTPGSGCHCGVLGWALVFHTENTR